MNNIKKASQKQLIKVLVSSLFGNVGSGILSFIIGLLILKSTNSALSFGISQIIGPVVALLLLPLTGSIVDKFNKKKIILFAQLLSIISLLGYATIIYFQDFGNLLYIYILLIFLKISDQFLTTTFTSSIINIVDESHIHKLKSFQQTINALIMMVVPLIAVLLYDLIPLFYLILLEIIIECITISIVITINFKFVTRSTNEVDGNEKLSILYMFREGLLFISKRKKLIFALFFSMLVNLMFGAINVGIPFVQINVLHFPDNIYGLTESIFSFGMILAGIILSAIKEIKYPLLSSWRMVGSIGLLLILLGISLSIQSPQVYNIIIVSLFNLLIGFSITWTNIPVTIWMTKEIPENYQGRVFNIVNTVAQLLAPLGILIFSGLFDWFNSFTIFILAGTSVVLITLLYPIVFKVNLKSNELQERATMSI